MYLRTLLTFGLQDVHLQTPEASSSESCVQHNVGNLYLGGVCASRIHVISPTHVQPNLLDEQEPGKGFSRLECMHTMLRTLLESQDAVGRQSSAIRS